jgi:hypothetical protein
LDVRFLAGIHRGCLRVQAGVKTKHSHDSGPERKANWCTGNGDSSVRFRKSCLRRPRHRCWKRYYMEGLPSR